MRIRTKLVLAFLLLAVLPLAAIVFVNYLSSISVFRQGVESEVRSQAEELNDRMEEARTDLGRRIRALGSMSLDSLADGSVVAAPQGLLVEGQMDQFGDLAPMVESVEVIPLPPHATEVAVPEAPSSVAALAPDEQAPDPESVETSMMAESFVIYLDSVLEAAQAAEGDPAAIERNTTDATEEFFRELGEGLGEHAERLAEAAQQVDERLEENERQVEELSDELQNPTLSLERRDELNEERRRAARSLRQTAREKQRLEQEEIEALQRGWEEAKGILGRSFDWKIQRDGQVVAEVRAQISPQNLLASILGRARRDQGEVPFALGPDHALYTVEPEDQELLDGLSLDSLALESDTPYIAFQDGWLIVASLAPESDVTLGIARPIGESLAAMRQNAVRNFGFGLGAIVFAMIGILPLSRRMTHNIRQLSRSVDRLAAGESEVAVDIKSRDEIGQLAHNFNRLASDLHHQRERLIDEVRRREEQETRERLLEAENLRKSHELEDARAFQLSLLPAQLPEHEDLVVAVHMRTATEVGGDYYDFLAGADGSLTVAIGDATGHGAKAGTMVTAIKSLFTASADGAEPAEFLAQSSDTIKRMNLGRMAMALTLLRYDADEIRIASAGMPPPLLWSARTGEVEEIELTGLPLGGLANSTYGQTSRKHGTGRRPAADERRLPRAGRIQTATPRATRPSSGSSPAWLTDTAGHPVGPRGGRRGWRAARALLDDITFVVIQHSGRSRG